MGYLAVFQFERYRGCAPVLVLLNSQSTNRSIFYFDGNQYSALTGRILSEMPFSLKASIEK